jgi:hypothetical protein
MLSPEVAHRLTADGYDVICLRDRGAMLRAHDAPILDYAVREGRAVCTKNARHFQREHEQYQERGEIHFGILALGDWRREAVYWALRQLLETHEDVDLLNEFRWIEEASPEFVNARMPAEPSEG